MRNVPVESVTAVRSPCSCGLVAVTVTPGRTAPCGSATVPMICPVVCAMASVAVETTSATAQNACFHLMCCALVLSQSEVASRQHGTCECSSQHSPCLSQSDGNQPSDGRFTKVVVTIRFVDLET